MAKDLTTSEISRQNILNNPVALPRIREALEIKPLEFNGVLYVTKQMAADFYEVDLRTITNCLKDNEEELKKNGYRVLKGKELKDFKLQYVKEIDFSNKMPQLGVFDFRSFLNIGMLLTERIWDMILEIVREIAECFNIEDEQILDMLVNRSDKLSHFVEIYQLKLES